MKLLDTIFGRNRESKAVIQGPTRPLEKSIVQLIWESPVDYNRETRRRAHLYGRFWKWDLSANEETRRVYIPRYLRRHFDPAKFLAPKTRRQRRHRARILAISNRTAVGR